MNFTMISFIIIPQKTIDKTKEIIQNILKIKWDYLQIKHDERSYVEYEITVQVFMKQ